MASVCFVDEFASADYRKEVWDYTMDKIENEIAVAGFLGTLYTVSKLNPSHTDGKPDDFPVKIFKNNEYPSIPFGKADFAYGIAGWRLWSRKQSLCNLAKARETDISDIQLQLDFLFDELNGVTYGKILDKLKGVKLFKEAVDILLYEYLDDMWPKMISPEECERHASNFYTLFSKKKEREKLTVPVNYARVNTAVAVLHHRATTFSVPVGIVRKNEEFQMLTDSPDGHWRCIFVNNKIAWIKAEKTSLFRKLEER